MLNRAQLTNDHNDAHQGDFVRYAIYYTPQPGTPLAMFGRSWFGRANDGATLQAFSEAGLSGATTVKPLSKKAAMAACMRCSRRRFSCATIWASTRSRRASSVSPAAARRWRPDPLTLARAGRYLVLRPIKPTPALDWLAAQCVATFDAFAESPADAEAPACVELNDHQRLLLKSFGDPHVLSEYRFYITSPAH